MDLSYVHNHNIIYFDQLHNHNIRSIQIQFTTPW